MEQASIESARLEKALAQAKEIQHDSNSRLASADSDWKNSIQAIEALREEQLTTESERNQAFDQLAVLRTDLASGRAQLEVLEQAEAAMTGYSDGTRTLLEDTDKLKQTGVIGALNQRLDVPADVEVAISAALGDFLDGALLSDAPESALDLLIERSMRGALIPFSQIKRIEADEQGLIWRSKSWLVKSTA